MEGNRNRNSGIANPFAQRSGLQIPTSAYVPFSKRKKEHPEQRELKLLKILGAALRWNGQRLWNICTVTGRVKFRKFTVGLMTITSPAKRVTLLRKPSRWLLGRKKVIKRFYYQEKRRAAGMPLFFFAGMPKRVGRIIQIIARGFRGSDNVNPECV